MNNGLWWVEYKIEQYGNEKISVPSNKKPIYSETKPEGNYWGGFHCQECASLCASFGMTEKRAYLRNHGTIDQRIWS